MNTQQPFDNKEYHTLLDVAKSQILSFKEYTQTIIVQDKLSKEINDKTVFDIEYIKKIYAILSNTKDEHSIIFRTNNSTDNSVNRIAAYLVNQNMFLYERMVLKKQDMNICSTQKLIEYIAQAFSELLLISPFSSRNIQVACILTNLLLYKRNLKKIDFIKINQITLQEYTEALREAHGLNYTPMANIIKSIM